MKLLFIKISTILLALLVLFSTFSFSVEKHYCGDFLVDISYLGNADSCGSISNNDTCETIIKKKECCKDEVEQIKGQDEIFKDSLDKISFDKVKFVLAFYASYKLPFQALEKQDVSHTDYTPPDLIFDIQVLHEVFII
ncbi:hypothetical protein PG913_10995 [Tenacibaculum pacificus]|uniref:HYC_CC_PP family protein n=1 Tax=Tenacibaculum pacificus TaxID=3018314 RepID=UPI0022F3D8E3|nr:hypothetical protein [Tenacibaculum pacificus]WBX73364.1 hypothetical protein PG913_10995 [Tenacibaculum pacificus]